MKNRYFILSVLFWAITSVLFAVKLPSSAYMGGTTWGGDSYETQIFSGTSFKGSTLLTTSNVDVDTEVCEKAANDNGDPTKCGICCYNDVYLVCKDKGGTDEECGALNVQCNQYCTEGSSLPLGSPLLLLPFIAIYAVIRRRKEETL